MKASTPDYGHWLSTLTDEQKASIPKLTSGNLKEAISAAEDLLGRKIRHQDPTVKDFFASRRSMSADNFAALLVLEHKIEVDVEKISSELGPIDPSEFNW